MTRHAVRRCMRDQNARNLPPCGRYAKQLVADSKTFVTIPPSPRMQLRRFRQDGESHLSAILASHLI